MPVPAPTVLRYAAFTDTPAGGNPAGVVLDAAGLSDERMLAIAAELGYSETAFLAGRASAGEGPPEFDVRYFSPAAEVPFCGHATIAAAVALAERDGPGALLLHIQAGEMPVRTEAGEQGLISATLTSVAPAVYVPDPAVTARALGLLRWSADELDTRLPPRIAFAGARHLILAAATRARLARLDYDFAGLRELMLALDLTTVDLVWREGPLSFHARNPFPVGGVVEDPATGAAAAALGAYLRELGAIEPPAEVRVHQGYDLGRPSELLVTVDADRPEISVSGRAVAIGD